MFWPKKCGALTRRRYRPNLCAVVSLSLSKGRGLSLLRIHSAMRLSGGLGDRRNHEQVRLDEHTLRDHPCANVGLTREGRDVVSRQRWNAGPGTIGPKR